MTATTSPSLAMVMPPRAAARPELTQTLTFDELETTRRVLVMDPVASAALRPGKYTMRVALGERRSAAVAFTVDLAIAPDPLVLAQWEQMEGRTDRALEILEAALAKDPAGKALWLR